VYSEVKIREANFWQVICSQTGARTEGPNFHAANLYYGLHVFIEICSGKIKKKEEMNGYII
jgi:hypothetical protein